MTTRDQILAIQNEIKEVHALGVRVCAKIKKSGGKYIAGLVSSISEEEEVSGPLLRKAIKFAETFSTEELREFLRLRTPSGSPLSISVAYQIMYLRNRRQRSSIARITAENGWSIRDVKAEVRKRVAVDEKGRKGGRRPRMPVDLPEALRQLDDKCDQWQRWIGHFEARDEESTQASAMKLSPNLKKRVAAVTDSMSKLAEAVAKTRANPTRKS